MTIARSVASGVAKGVASAVTRGQGGGSSSFDYIGADALAAYSVIPLKTETTRCFRVRRSSDNTEQDCLTIAEAVTFCGGGSGFLVTLYDQASTKNTTQSTTTQQPRIVNSGVADSGFVLDGVNDFLTAGDVLPFEWSDPFTLTAWIKTSATGDVFIAAKQLNALPFSGYYFLVASGKVNVNLQNSSSNYASIASTNSVNNNAWRHIAVTNSGAGNAAGLKIYVDGIEETPVGVSDNRNGSLLNAAHFTIGSRTSGGVPFSGSIFGVGVYNVVKSAAQILALKNAVTPS